MQNETGSRAEKWHKTDTRGSVSVRTEGKKENAAPAGPRNGIKTTYEVVSSNNLGSTHASNLEAETLSRANVFDRLERLDSVVLETLAKPDGCRRNGQYCFTRRSRIAREVGVSRDVLNAAIRRLTEAGCLRSVYSNVLACWGLEICADVAAIRWRAQ
nr:hypothetical protein [Pseudomonadota bacterium]